MRRTPAMGLVSATPQLAKRIRTIKALVEQAKALAQAQRFLTRSLIATVAMNKESRWFAQARKAILGKQKLGQ